MAVDDSGNVMVTGDTCAEGSGGDCQTDFTTILYDTDGNVVLVDDYPWEAVRDNRAVGVEVDGDGNFIVAGTIWRYIPPSPRRRTKILFPPEDTPCPTRKTFPSW